MKGKRKARAKGEFVVTSDVLVEIIEESIRVFWRFVRADKNTSGSGWKGFQHELQDPADSDLFIGVQTALQKVNFPHHLVERYSIKSLKLFYLELDEPTLGERCRSSSN